MEPPAEGEGMVGVRQLMQTDQGGISSGIN